MIDHKIYGTAFLNSEIDNKKVKVGDLFEAYHISKNLTSEINKKTP